MIGNLVAVRQPQEIAQRERVRATPRNAALAVDPLGQGTPREAAEAAYAFIFTLRTETVLVFGMIAVVEGEFAALVLIAPVPPSSRNGTSSPGCYAYQEALSLVLAFMASLRGLRVGVGQASLGMGAP